MEYTTLGRPFFKSSPKAMSPDLYRYVLRCFELLQPMYDSDDIEDLVGQETVLQVTLPIDPDNSVLRITGPQHRSCCMHSKYNFGIWTFDTCSPRLLRFSSPGLPSCDYNASILKVLPNFYTVVPGIWKVVFVDLFSDGSVIEEDPHSCALTLSLAHPNFGIRTLRSWVTPVMKLITIRLCSVYGYSEVRKELLCEATKLVDDIASVCESYLFHPPFIPTRDSGDY